MAYFGNFDFNTKHKNCDRQEILCRPNLNSSWLCICSAQSKNWYDSGIVPAQSRNPTLSATSGTVPDYSRIAQDIYIMLSSDSICAQSRNRVGQSRNVSEDNRTK